MAGPRYRIELADIAAHRYRVTLTLDNPAAEQQFHLPVWIPGSYLVREFAKHLSGLTARQGSRELAVEQVDKAGWRVRCSGRAALVLSYDVYAFDASVRTAWLDSQRAFFNPSSLCLRAVGREAHTHRIVAYDEALVGEIGLLISKTEEIARSASRSVHCGKQAVQVPGAVCH